MRKADGVKKEWCESRGRRYALNNCYTIVQHQLSSYFMTATIGFRPTERMSRSSTPQCAAASARATSSGGHRSCSNGKWIAKPRTDAERLRDEDVSTEPDAW